MDLDGVYYISFSGEKVRLYIKSSLAFSATYSDAGLFRIVANGDFSGHLIICSTEAMCEDAGHIFMSGKHDPMVVTLVPEMSLGDAEGNHPNVSIKCGDKWLAYSVYKSGHTLTSAANRRTLFQLEESISEYAGTIEAPRPVVISKKASWQSGLFLFYLGILLIVLLALFL